jgi:hypothetical protein
MYTIVAHMWVIVTANVGICMYKYIYICICSTHEAFEVASLLVTFRQKLAGSWKLGSMVRQPEFILLFWDITENDLQQTPL